METSKKILIILSLLVAFTAAITAGAGLFWQEPGQPFSFTTLHGQTVEIYGRGLYRYDTAFKSPILRGTDVITLFVAVPLLCFAIGLYRRDTLRGKVFLTSILTWFLYNSASVAFGAAYNNLLLVYTVSFSASIFAFILAFSSVNLKQLAASILPRLPHRGIAIFLFFAGLSVFVWLIEIIGGLAQGLPPKSLGPYTTDITTIIDIGLIFPSVYLAGIMLLRRAPLGYLLAPVMLTLNAFVGLVVAGQTVVQTLDGIRLSLSEYAAYVVPFLLMSVISTWLLARVYNAIKE